MDLETQEINGIRVGQRVTVRSAYRLETNQQMWEGIREQVGTVLALVDASQGATIEFDEEFYGGHRCNGKVKNKRGRWIPSKYLIPLHLDGEDLIAALINKRISPEMYEKFTKEGVE